MSHLPEIKSVKAGEITKESGPYIAHIPSGPPCLGTDVQVLVDQVQDLLR